MYLNEHVDSVHFAAEVSNTLHFKIGFNLYVIHVRRGCLHVRSCFLQHMPRLACLPYI